MKETSPNDFADAVFVDKSLRSNSGDTEQFMHRALIPLSDVDFDKNSPQIGFSFLDECEGMCGL